MAGRKSLGRIGMDAPATADELLAIRCFEELVREDLKPIERAKAFRALMDLNGWSGNQLARELSITSATVTRLLSLLELPEAIQSQVEQGALHPTTAYEVSRLDDPALQAQVATRAVAEKMSRAEVAAAVREAQPKSSKPKGGGAPTTASRVIKTTTGIKVTFESRRGTDDAAIMAALREILAQLKAKYRDDDEAA